MQGMERSTSVVTSEPVIGGAEPEPKSAAVIVSV